MFYIKLFLFIADFLRSPIKGNLFGGLSVGHGMLKISNFFYSITFIFLTLESKHVDNNEKENVANIVQSTS